MTYPQPYTRIATEGLAPFYLLAIPSHLLRSTSQPLAYQDQLLNAISDCYTLICLYNQGSASLTDKEKAETLEQAASTFDRMAVIYVQNFNRGTPFGNDLKAAKLLAHTITSFFGQDMKHPVQRRLIDTVGTAKVMELGKRYKLLE